MAAAAVLVVVVVVVVVVTKVGRLRDFNVRVSVLHRWSASLVTNQSPRVRVAVTVTVRV